jgi:hypothetical protein
MKEAWNSRFIETTKESTMNKLSIIRGIFDQRDNDLQEVVNLGARGCFDFVDLGSRTLTVVIGDSWTFGWRLPEEVDGDEETKNHHRVSNTFGWHISQQKNSDYLNISVPACNNIWMAEKFCRLVQIVDDLKYDHVEVIMMMTEYGREFHTDFDFAPDYGKIYQKCNSVYDVARGISQHIIALLEQHQHSRVSLTLATTYVDNLYPPSKINYMERSWLEVLVDRKLESQCLVVGSWVIPKFENLKEYNVEVDRIKITKELEEIVDQAQRRLDIIYNTGFNYQTGYGHPNSAGHRKFADYYLERRS